MWETMLASVGADTSDIEVVGCYGDTCHVVSDRHRRRLRPQVIVCQEQTADICEGPRCVPIEEIYPKVPVLRLGRGLVDRGMTEFQTGEEQKVLAALRIHVLSNRAHSPEEKERDVSLRPASRLTQREMQIVSFLRNNLTNKEIAGELRLSVQTVKNQLHHLFEKLQVKTRRQALRSLLR